MRRTKHSRWKHSRNFVPDFSGAERRTRIVIGVSAMMMVLEITVGLTSRSMTIVETVGRS